MLYLRQHASAALVDRLRTLIARVRQLDAERSVKVEVTTWGPMNPALEELSDSGPSVSLTVKSFQAWADRHGYTLHLAFTRRETTSMIQSRPAVEIRVPIACLAVHEDEELICVAPCSDGERTHTVEACLTALEEGLTEPFALGEHREPTVEDATMGTDTH